MNEEKLVPVPVGPKGVELHDLDAMFRFATCYLQSGLAPKSFVNPQQLVICWAKAAELGLSPLQAVEGMSIIGNRVGIMGDLALAMVEASGLLQDKHVEYTGNGQDLVCTLTLQRKGREPKEYTFSVQEAVEAQIYQRNPVWKSYPKRMTYYRALGFGLRDEFSDILKGTKTIEELQDYSDAINEEEKIASAQRREKEVHIPGATYVESKGRRPTPEEAAEPAFEEDKERPGFAEQLQKDFPKPESPKIGPKVPPSPAPVQTKTPGPAVTPVQPTTLVDDNLDMGEQATQDTPGQPATVQAPAPEPAWKTWVLKGITNARFVNRKLGDLNELERNVLEKQWLPQMQARWDQANAAQKADYPMVQACLAYHNVAKPWGE